MTNTAALLDFLDRLWDDAHRLRTVGEYLAAVSGNDGNLGNGIVASMFLREVADVERQLLGVTGDYLAKNKGLEALADARRVLFESLEDTAETEDLMDSAPRGWDAVQS